MINVDFKINDIWKPENFPLLILLNIHENFNSKRSLQFQTTWCTKQMFVLKSIRVLRPRVLGLVTCDTCDTCHVTSEMEEKKHTSVQAMIV